MQVADSSVNVEDEVIANLTGDNLWDSISMDESPPIKGIWVIKYPYER